MSIFGWLNDQLLRMQWLSDLVTAGVAAVGLDPASRLGGSVQFFVYDVIKIFILLSVLIFAISWVQSFFPPERTRRILGGRSGLWANTLAALLGHDHALLFLFVDPDLHRLHGGRTAARRSPSPS